MLIELDFTIQPYQGGWVCEMEGRILAGHTPLEALHHGLQGVVWSGRYRVAKKVEVEA